MKKLFTPGETVLWAGSQASFDALTLAIPLAEKMQADMSGKEERFPPIISKQDGVAVIDISGSLINGEAGWMRYFGVLGYHDINNALVTAMLDPEVKQVLMHINSGGGQVDGVMELSNTITRMQKAKPIDTHSSKMMASAAYWIGANGRHVSADQTTLVGSVGVLTVHMEISKQLEQDGIKATVLRAGDFKALANKYEPLTEEAKAQIQSQLDDIYSLFIGHIADARGVTASVADKQMGQGKEFLGKRALDAGLVDKIAGYDKVISFVKKIDGGKVKPDNPQNSKGKAAMKVTLSDAQLAAIAAGADAAVVMAQAEAAAKAAAEMTDEQKATAAKALADAALAATAKAEAEAKSAADAAAAIATAAKPDAVVTHLTTQLAAANEALIAAKVEAAGAKAAIESQAALLTIARGAVGKMLVALGGSAVSADSLDAKAVVAEHERVSQLFLTQFKPGGVATPVTPKKDEAAIDPRFYSAVKNAPSSTKQ